MTDRYNALTVVLDHDIRSDDAESIINAIEMIRCVLSVKPKVSNIDDHIAYDRVRSELGKELWEILYPKNK